jgi:hypothetical protein
MMAHDVVSLRFDGITTLSKRRVGHFDRLISVQWMNNVRLSIYLATYFSALSWREEEVVAVSTTLLGNERL